jgi:hypothetical protein
MMLETQLEKQESGEIVSLRQEGPFESLAQRINDEHKACQMAVVKALEHAIKAGEWLAKAKSKCPRGTWRNWLENNFEGSERTAQLYKRLYENRESLQNRNGVADLSLRQAVAKLANPKMDKVEGNGDTASEVEDEEEATLTTELYKVEDEEKSSGFEEAWARELFDPDPKKPDASKKGGLINKLANVIDRVPPESFAEYYLAHGGDQEEIGKITDWWHKFRIELEGQAKEPEEAL